MLVWNADIRSRQAGVSFLVEQILTQWLAKAIGQSWNEILQRLALRVTELMSPEQR